MNSKEIRQHFLDFFKSKEHAIVKSAPLVLKNDPTLMFTNAGMNQFKDFFLGDKIATNKRIADTQKCLRVSGKHNDLEDVGIDTYHHTMFEMLGNWSFGDYFKEDAIAWAWELLTKVYKLPEDKLYVTVFEGDKKENLDFDQEAYDIWIKYVKADKIIRGNKKDNFWEMGDVGPCGPCSEIHIDLRSEEEINRIPGKERVNNDDPQVIEIWNIVFIQFNRKADGSLEPLPDKHVDTGMGFERLVRAIQGKSSNYDTDVFMPSISFLEQQSGLNYGNNEKTDIAMRVISDHVRAISFAIADGQLPSNAKAGYVIRRILRRAVRYGYTFLDFKEPFIYKLMPILSDQFADVFLELKAQETFISNVIKEEEQSFLRTLDQGIKILDSKIQQLSNTKIIDGKTAFELYDTFGFPLDLTALIARENSFSLDEAGFEIEMKAQKDRSRNATSVETGDWITVNLSEKVEFIGYDLFESTTQIIKHRTLKAQGKDVYQLVLEKTPFYPESGGQVGDTGALEIDGEKILVLDTKKESDLIINYVNKFPISFNGTIRAKVDVQKRKLTQNNHSATHLLQAALKSVLGNHIAQKGSLVNQELLRFDFSHFTKITDEELLKIEHQVNEKIRENINLNEKRNVPINDALKLGATALFGEKYGDFVRIITFDPNYSVELCGGTHVQATGSIGYFKILSESSVAAGVRRIEALTAYGAEKLINEQSDSISKISELLKVSKDLPKAVENLLAERTALLKKTEQYEQQHVQLLKKELLSKINSQDGINIIVQKVNLSSAEAVKTLAFELKNQVDNLYAVLCASIDEKPHIAVMISDNLVKERNLNASAIVRELAKEIQGGGGGQPFFATAGGKDLNGLDNVVKKALQTLLVTN